MQRLKDSAEATPREPPKPLEAEDPVEEAPEPGSLSAPAEAERATYPWDKGPTEQVAPSAAPSLAPSAAPGAEDPANDLLESDDNGTDEEPAWSAGAEANDADLRALEEAAEEAPGWQSPKSEQRKELQEEADFAAEGESADEIDPLGLDDEKEAESPKETTAQGNSKRLKCCLHDKLRKIEFLVHNKAKDQWMCSAKSPCILETVESAVPAPVVPRPVSSSAETRSRPSTQTETKTGVALVMCTIHKKMRHPDRMARKANGDWVCTGEDMCGAKVQERRTIGSSSGGSSAGVKSVKSMVARARVRLRGPAERTGAPKTGVNATPLGSARSSSSRPGGVVRPKASSVRPSVGSSSSLSQSLRLNLSSRIRPPPKPPSRSLSDRSSIRPRTTGSSTSHRGSNRSSPPRQSARGRSRDRDRDGSSRTASRHTSIGGGTAASARAPPPVHERKPGTIICAIHKKPRHPDRLERRGGQWVCRPGDRCHETNQELKCHIHGRMRTAICMEKNRDGKWVCKVGHECK
eukprot:TRINITY_DN24644_c0_g1_i1.p1 TRINITY_DN24644_c0_g1~~TRINITY_DN24644_c0_g1_i1.p1  ORF type:complete len:521 (+),score=116.34 TRINITY_DN24644_c0_g1_i1:285-1847(+)